VHLSYTLFTQQLSANIRLTAKEQAEKLPIPVAPADYVFY